MFMTKKIKTAVIIPTFNEKSNIVLLIRKIIEYYPEIDVYIEDDNSPDGTADLVKKKFEHDPRIIVSVAAQKQGRGAAVMRGFRKAFKNKSTTIFIEMDADLSHDPKLIRKIVKSVNSKTIASCSRYIAGGKITGWGLHRTVFSWCANLLIRLCNLSNLQDNTNGFRGYHRDAVNVLLNHSFLTTNYVALVESATVLSHRGYKYLEIPSHFQNRNSGTSNTTPQLALRSFVDVFRVAFHLKSHRK
jgi:glycosyltransferase involved in cell wall biosynthesis